MARVKAKAQRSRPAVAGAEGGASSSAGPAVGPPTDGFLAEDVEESEHEGSAEGMPAPSRTEAGEQQQPRSGCLILVSRWFYRMAKQKE